MCHPLDPQKGAGLNGELHLAPGTERGLAVVTHPCSPLPLPLVAAGDVISRLTSDTTIVSDLVSQNINIFLRNVVKATGVIFFMFSLSWKLSLVTFMGFPIIMLVSDVYGKYYKVGRGAGVAVMCCSAGLKPLWRLWWCWEWWD